MIYHIVFNNGKSGLETDSFLSIRQAAQVFENAKEPFKVRQSGQYKHHSHFQENGHFDYWLSPDEDFR